MTVFDFAVENLALSFIAYELADGQHPPYVHLAFTKRHSRDRCSRPSPFFALFRFRVLSKNKKRGRPGNEARKQTHVGMEPQKTNQTRWIIHAMNNVVLTKWSIALLSITSEAWRILHLRVNEKSPKNSYEPPLKELRYYFCTYDKQSAFLLYF